MTDHALPHDHLAAGSDHAPAHGSEEPNWHVLNHEIASIYPAICGMGTATMLFGTAANWNAFAWGLGASIVGFAVLVFGMCGWWGETIKDNELDEETLIGTPEATRQGLKIGFGFFIGSEVMFFSAFFAYYFYSRYISAVWPPPGFEYLPWQPALVNTALLVISGFFYMRGEHLLVHGAAKAKTLFWMVLALVFGFVFLGVQAKEWSDMIFHEGFTAQTGNFGTAFFLLTGFHGLHVIIGAIMITVITVRISKDHFTPKKHFAMVAAGWYWHFVDVVWIGLVLCVYLYDYFRDMLGWNKHAAIQILSLWS